MRFIGLDPGLRTTGWGIIEAQGSRLRHVAHGIVTTDAERPLAERLKQLYVGLLQLLQTWRPDEAAVEETFVNRNPTTTLKLGQARAVALLAPAMAGVPVAEYTPNLIKKSVVGTGHAAKPQVAMMVATLLPGAEVDSADAADALAAAICHAHHRQTQQRIAAASAAAGLRP